MEYPKEIYGTVRNGEFISCSALEGLDLNNGEDVAVYNPAYTATALVGTMLKDAAPKSRRGRPKGSKNKPKTEV